MAMHQILPWLDQQDQNRPPAPTAPPITQQDRLARVKAAQAELDAALADLAAHEPANAT